MSEELRKAMIEYRAKHNLSQQKMAEKCNISLQTYNSVEGGTQTPSELTRAKIELIVKGE